MEILRTISLYAESKQMPFVVIGGHAANALGIARNTADLDLMVQRSIKAAWLALLEKLNYSKGQDDERFARFRASSLANWPIDLMFVDDATFTKIFDSSKDARFGDASAKVISAKHLAVLKIHALKHFQEHRFSKDYSDLVTLLKSGQTGFSDEDLKELCERYASLALYDKIKEN